MFRSKGSYGKGEPRNANFVAVQIAYKLVRTCKLLGFIQCRTRPTMEICVHSGLPIAVVPCLHQSIVHVKRKLWERRAYKCKHCCGATSVKTCTGLQTAWFHAAPSRADNGNLRTFGATYCHGTMFASKYCPYQKEAIRKESPKM